MCGWGRGRGVVGRRGFWKPKEKGQGARVKGKRGGGGIGGFSAQQAFSDNCNASEALMHRLMLGGLGWGGGGWGGWGECGNVWLGKGASRTLSWAVTPPPRSWRGGRQIWTKSKGQGGVLVWGGGGVARKEREAGFQKARSSGHAWGGMHVLSYQA